METFVTIGEMKASCPGLVFLQDQVVARAAWAGPCRRAGLGGVRAARKVLLGEAKSPGGFAEQVKIIVSGRRVPRESGFTNI